MAYDKLLKVQWTEINGRTVPLVLPQYWDESVEDWVVSSTSNRLPVDAQLTGSMDELYSDRDFQMSAGAIVDVITPSDFQIFDYKEIIFGVSASNNHDFRVEAQFFGQGYSFAFHYPIEIAHSEGTNRALSNPVRVRTPYIRIRLANLSTLDQTYSYSKLIGVR